MRVFVAIELSEDIKEYIYKKRKFIENESKEGRFTSKDNYHLTLKFIGEVKEDQISLICDTMKIALSGKKAFKMNLSDLHYFQKGRSKILFFDVENNQKKLNNLHEIIEESLFKIGYEKENRSFTPHITIGRKVKLKLDIDELNELLDIDNRSIKVKKISLMESTRINGELKYIPLCTYDLK